MLFFKSPLKSIQYGLCLIVCAALLASCGEDSKLTRHIPKDAAGVLALDMKSLALKSMDFQEILKLENLKKMFSASDDSVSQAFRNAGIDFMNKGYVFAKGTGAGKGYGAGVVALSDATAFEAFIKKMNPEANVAEEGGIKVAELKDSVVVAWNKTEAIVVIAEENGKETAVALVNLKKDESVVGQATFADVEKLEADIAFWMNLDAIQTLIPQSPYAPPTPPMNLKDSYVTATCNFEDGQIVIDGKTYANDEMAKTYNLLKPSVKSEIVETVPGSSVIALAGFGLDMGALTTYLESQNMLEMYDGLVQQQTGLTAKEILAMFDGNMAVSLNGVTMMEKPSFNYMTGEQTMALAPDFDYSLVLGIANKETANKLLAKFTELGALVKSDNYYAMGNEMFIIEKGDAFVITHTDARRQSIIDGKGEKLNSDLSGLFSANAGAMYMNTNNIPAEFLTGQNAVMGTHLANLLLDDITYTSSSMKDKVSTSRFVVRLRSKDENSLITITKIMKSYGESMQTFQYATPSESTTTEEISAEEAEADAVQE
jgi:hypothetical protein